MHRAMVHIDTYPNVLFLVIIGGFFSEVLRVNFIRIYASHIHLSNSSLMPSKILLKDWDLISPGWPRHVCIRSVSLRSLFEVTFYISFAGNVRGMLIFLLQITNSVLKFSVNNYFSIDRNYNYSVWDLKTNSSSVESSGRYNFLKSTWDIENITKVNWR